MKTVTLSSNTSWYLFNFRAFTIRRLISDGYRVVCLSPHDEYSRKLVDELGAEWLPLPMDNMGSNPLIDMALVARLWRHYHTFETGGGVPLHYQEQCLWNLGGYFGQGAGDKHCVGVGYRVHPQWRGGVHRPPAVQTEHAVGVQGILPERGRLQIIDSNETGAQEPFIITAGIRG